MLIEEAEVAGAGLPVGARLPEALLGQETVQGELATWCARAAALTRGAAPE